MIRVARNPVSARSAAVAVRRSKIARLRKRIEALQLEALVRYVPLPHVADFHESRKRKTILDGSNRSGKTHATMIELARAVTGTDPYEKYPKRNGFALVVAYDQDHVANPLWSKLTQEGQIKLIRDEHTGQWRSVRPDPNNPRRLDPYDEAYREKWHDAAPMLPPRVIKHVAYDDAGKDVPRLVELVTGWKILFRASGGEPPQGIALNLALFDEELKHSPKWLNETIPRLCEDGAKFIWGATPLSGGRPLLMLRQEADRGSRFADRYTLLLRDNPYFSDEAKEFFAAGLTDDAERAARIHGEYRLLGRVVYPSYDAMGVHGCDPFPVPAHYCRYCVLDPGTQNLGCLFLAVDPEQTHVWVYDGFQLPKTHSREWAFEVKRRSEGHRFQAYIIDKRAGRQHPFGANSEGLNVAQQYWRMVQEIGIEPAQTGPLGGFFPGSDDVAAREEALRSWLALRGAGHCVNTPVLQVFRGVLPELDKQIAFAETISAVSDKRSQEYEENLLECLEYGAAFGPQYFKPPSLAQLTAPDPVVAAMRQFRQAGRPKRAAREIDSTIAIRP